jgi:hypothetical protein
MFLQGERSQRFEIRGYFGYLHMIKDKNPTPNTRNPEPYKGTQIAVTSAACELHC